MIRHSARTGRTRSTSSIQREVIQAQGHTGSNQNCTFSRTSDCAVTLAGTATRARLFPPGRARQRRPADRAGSAGLACALGKGLIQEGGGGLRGVGAGKLLGLPGLLGAVAQAAWLQVDQPGGAVVAQGRAGLAAPLAGGQVQEGDRFPFAVRGRELLDLPGRLGALAQAAWLEP